MTKVRLAILGCGGMAGEHARRFKNNPDVEIVALCDVTTEQVRRFIERVLPEYTPSPTIYIDPATMYEEAGLDAVTIVTPHTLHFEHAMQALDAGCHVLMEKPMVTNAADAYALSGKVAESGKIFTIGYNTPCTPQFKYLRDLVRTQDLGKLETISCWLSQNWKRPTTGTWRQNPALSGGGQMYDSGAHLFNSLVWTVEQPIAEVFAFVDNSETPVDINGTVNIRFESGTLATVMVNGNCPASGADMTLCFTGGRVDIDGWGGSRIRVFKDNEELKDVVLEGTANTPNENFIDAILGRAEPRTSPLNGIQQTELMDAIYESVRTGRPATSGSRRLR